MQTAARWARPLKVLKFRWGVAVRVYWALRGSGYRRIPCLLLSSLELVRSHGSTGAIAEPSDTPKTQ